MNSFLGKIGGRKFIVALVGLIAVVLTSLGVFNVTPELQDKIVQAIVWICGVFVGGQSLADGLSGGATSTSAQELKKVSGTDVTGS